MSLLRQPWWESQVLLATCCQCTSTQLIQCLTTSTSVDFQNLIEEGLAMLLFLNKTSEALKLLFIYSHLHLANKWLNFFLWVVKPSAYWKDTDLYSIKSPQPTGDGHLDDLSRLPKMIIQSITMPKLWSNDIITNHIKPTYNFFKESSCSPCFGKMSLVSENP